MIYKTILSHSVSIISIYLMCAAPLKANEIENSVSAKYEQFECDVSLEPVSPIAGAKIGVGDSVTVSLNYSFKNVPSGMQISVFPGIISNEKDFQNFLPVKAISLFGDNTLIHDIASPARPSLQGELQFSYINQGENLGAFDSIIATLGFSHRATSQEAPLTISSTISPEINKLQPIPAKDIHCDRDITTTVDWFFSSHPTS